MGVPTEFAFWKYQNRCINVARLGAPAYARTRARAARGYGVYIYQGR
jgi:hypothetical protein